MQKIAAVANLVCYYGIGLPVGIGLMRGTEVRILGNAVNPTLSLKTIYTLKLNKPVIPVILMSTSHWLVFTSETVYNSSCVFNALFSLDICYKYGFE